MCPWVGPHATSFGRQLWGLPSRVEYLSPQGVLLPLVYSTTASPLWLELRGHSAWQATPSWTVYRLACHRVLPWLRVTFAMVPDAAWPGSDQWPWSTAPTTGPVGRLGRPSASDQWGVGSFLSLGRPTCVQCPGPLGSCSPVCPRGLWCCVCGVLGHLAPVHRCARSVCCVACAVSWATWLPFTGALAGCVVLRVRCPEPLGSSSPVCRLGLLCCVCGVLGHLAPVHRCARWVCCVACAVSWASWVLFTGVPARCVVLRVRCPGPLGSCSPVRPPGVLCCVCGVLGHLAPVHRCARSVGCFACAVFWACSLLLTGVPARCVVLRVRCPGPLRSCSPVCPLGVLCCVSGVLGHLAPVQRCARWVCCVAWAVSLATWLAFTGAPARCIVLRVRCPGPLFFFGRGGAAFLVLCVGVDVCRCRFWCGRGCRGGRGPVAVALWVPCVCAGPGASGFQGAGPGGADGGWLVAVVAWRLRGWPRLLGSAWVAWPGAGVRVGVFMAWADGVVGSVGVAGLCGCRVCVRRRNGGLGWGTVGDAMGGGDAGDAYGGGAVGVETGWCC